MTRAAGAGTVMATGHIALTRNGRRVLAHVLVAEAALGKRLPRGAVVHHVNEDPADNRGANLVICPDNAYHALIHQRTRAIAACGRADWRKCRFCNQYDAPGELWISSARAHHRRCMAARQRQRRNPTDKE